MWFLNGLAISLSILYCLESKSMSNADIETLKLVHVIFRHGDRTNTNFTIYPKDPYVNETYAPYGRGELTKKGKIRMYRVGKALRERYDKFLGSSYHPSLMEAISSDTNRSKSSLLLVLAGLFPPTQDEIWEAGINWQPIPFSHHPLHSDKIFFGIFDPKFKKLLQEYYESPKIAEELSNYETFFEKLSNHTGLNVTNYEQTFFLYLNLKSEEEWGLELPSWAKEIYPHPLKEIGLKHYSACTATTPMRQFVAGSLLQKILVNSKEKSDNRLQPPGRKLFLYSGHEFNIAFFLATLNIFEPHIPPYGSYILIELHQIKNIPHVKLLYQDYNYREPHMIKLQACEEYCPLEKFISLTEEYFPTEIHS